MKKLLRLISTHDAVKCHFHFYSTLAYFGNAFHALVASTQTLKVKRREGHDDRIMFEVICAQLYVLTAL